MPKRTFTLEQATARIQELRKIAQPIVQHYKSDLDLDEETITQHAGTTKAFLWLPRETGTHLARVHPIGKVWAEAYLHNQVTNHNQQPIYLITPKRMKRITVEEARRIINDIPDARYHVETRDQRRYEFVPSVTTSSIQHASRLYQQDPERVVVTELNTRTIMHPAS